VDEAQSGTEGVVATGGLTALTNELDPTSTGRGHRRRVRFVRLQNKHRRAEQDGGDRRRRPNARDQETWALYSLLGLVGYLLTALGATLAPLQDDLDVERAQVAFYPSLFAAGLLAIGVAGSAVVGRIGRVTYSRLALVLMVAGGLALCSGNRPLTMIGAALLGLGAAAVVQLVPAALTETHGDAAATALGEANALSSAAAVAGPLCVGAAIGLGIGWRAGFLALPLAAAVALAPLTRQLAPARRVAAGWASSDDLDEEDEGTSDQADDGPILGVWFNLLLAISVEFCVVFWAPEALIDWHDAGDGLAAALAGLFLLGMAVVRAGSSRLLAGREPRLVTAASALVAVGGFAAFWAGPNLLVAGLGLVVLGGGVALLYPVTVASVVAAWPSRPDAAAGRAALASALAVGAAPLALAAVAEVIGLRLSYLLVPIFLGLLVGRATCHTVRQ
jgi:MFS family permease